MLEDEARLKGTAEGIFSCLGGDFLGVGGISNHGRVLSVIFFFDRL